MTTYVSTNLPFGLVKRPGATSAPLGYVAKTKPTGVDVAAVSERLLSAGCSPKLVSAHLNYLYGSSSWKPAWLYSDGVVSTVDVLARRRAAFKVWFRAYLTRHIAMAAHDLDVEFLVQDFGYTKHSPGTTQYAPSPYVIGEIGVSVRSWAFNYTYSPPASGVPELLDGLECMCVQASYGSTGHLEGEYNFRWYDGSKWQVKMVTPWDHFVESEVFSETYVTWNVAGGSTIGSGPSSAEVQTFGQLLADGLVAPTETYNTFVKSSGHSKMDGVAVGRLFTLPMSAHVGQVWWNVGHFDIDHIPVSLTAIGRGALVTSASLADTLQLTLQGVEDAGAQAEVDRVRASGSSWIINFVNERSLRRKVSELSLAAEGDISAIENENLVAPGTSDSFPTGITLKGVAELLIARSLKEGVTFRHMVVQSRDDFANPTTLGLVVMVDYVGGSFRYTYPSDYEVTDVLAVMTDGASVTFSVSVAASTALQNGVLHSAQDRWALDSFGKTYASLLLESERLSREVTSLWNPAHYYDRFRPWRLVDVDKAELAFLLEVSGGFNARAMLISASEAESYSTYK